MKIAELRERTAADLEQLEGELARDLWKTRFNNYTNQLDDTAKIGRLRKQIARVKTLLGQKAKGEAAPVAKAKAPKAEKKAAAPKAEKAPKAKKAKAEGDAPKVAKTKKAKG